jgi:hypothetical protein
VRLLREYEKTGALPVHSLAEYETLASDLVKACDSGEDGAMRRVADHFQIRRMLSWDQSAQEARVERLRRFARERLGAQANSGNESGAIALTDAQLLVARSLGFKSWEQLAKHIEQERYAE